MDRFIVKKKRLNNDFSPQVELNNETSSASLQEPTQVEVMSLPSSSPSKQKQVSVKNLCSLDIGSHIGKMSQLSDHTKYQLFTKHWKPNKDYKFPTSSHIKRGREEQRRVNIGHFEKHPWLVFSEAQEGLFCKYCAVFCHKKMVGGQHTVPVKKFVSEPLKKYAKLSGKDGDLESHASTAYHKEAENDAKSFITMFENPNLEIVNLLNENRKAQIIQNRSRLVPVIKTILLHGRQNIPLRGHRDDGSLIEVRDDPVQNYGNFRALLRFRIDSGDVQLEEHLKSAGANATYISKTTANALINCCGDEILEVIKQRVSEAKYYAIMFDETTDASHTSQLSLSLRYVYDQAIREDFVGFIDLHNTNYSDAEDAEVEPVITGEVLGQSVLKFMQDLGLNMNNCVGICCDGCSVNMSDMRGAVTEIQKVATNSTLCGCKNHALNLTISKCNSLQNVRNAVGTVKEITRFFNSSGKRNFVLKKVLGHQMRGYCETRWVERHESILEFTEDLPKIAEALRNLSKWRDSSTASKGNNLLCSISTCDFIITMHCLSDITDATVVLSKYLQLESIDLCSAKEKITHTIKVLQDKREKSHQFFSLLFEAAEKTMETMDVEIRIPRLAEKQVNRLNYPSTSSDNRDRILQHWKRSVYIPMLDNIIADMNDRFSDNSVECYKLNIIVPTNLDKISDLKSSFEPICDKYSTLLSQKKDTMIMKLLNEICSLKNISNYTTFKTINKAMKCYEELDGNSYPLLKALVQILLTLPISIGQ